MFVGATKTEVTWTVEAQALLWSMNPWKAREHTSFPGMETKQVYIKIRCCCPGLQISNTNAYISSLPQREHSLWNNRICQELSKPTAIDVNKFSWFFSPANLASVGFRIAVECRFSFLGDTVRLNVCLVDVEKEKKNPDTKYFLLFAHLPLYVLLCVKTVVNTSWSPDPRKDIFNEQRSKQYGAEWRLLSNDVQFLKWFLNTILK